MLSIAEEFAYKGFITFNDLIDKDEVESLIEVYNKFLSNEIGGGKHRSDLSGDATQEERITQIMVPSRSYPSLLSKNLYKNAGKLAEKLIGSDVALDFDMLINKPPGNRAVTPWHQDASYWIDLPDKRAVSIWVALDQVNKENGCMQFVNRKGNKQLLKHHQPIVNGPMQCEYDGSEAEAIPLMPGSCTAHDGFTLHFSGENTSDEIQRRAIILNYRPKSMIDLERSLGYDHTGERKKRN